MTFNKYLFILLVSALLSLAAACNTGAGSSTQNGHSGEHAYTNALVNESSPYLLQHAHNPVNWYPWGDEALQKAQKEDKLLIISVGYAACHWCHVMEHESFEDTTVAELMNEKFVNIKVDREERPDVDQIYMDAVYLINQRGGWPLNAIALPDGRPIFAGTYYPKSDWLELTKYFSNEYENNKEELIAQAEKITEGVRQLEMVPLKNEDATFEMAEVESLFEKWKPRIDFSKGGKKGAPKFPMPNNYQYLLRHYHLTADEDALKAVTVTLNEMAYGGIYDHLGGGFARYSVDADWLVPHFEKMLYDNGQLVSLYSEAYQLTKDPLYKQVVEETITFVNRELRSDEGGYYSSLDADSEGEEGKFYVFTKEEVNQTLGEDADLFSKYYRITENGNWEEHKNILHVRTPKARFAEKKELTESELDALLARGKEKLFKERSKRVRPGLDDKVLTAWNALMLKGLVDAYRVFDKEDYLNYALKNADFIKKNMMKSDGRLDRNYKDGKSSINAFLDDYSLLIEAFVALYQATFDEQWLDEANKLAEYAIAHFLDAESGMFMYTSDLDPALIARKMEVADNVIPGSNSSMAKALKLLGTYQYDKKKMELSAQMLKNVKDDILLQPNFYSNWAHLILQTVKEPYEVAIVGPDAKKLRKELDQHFLPNNLVLGGETEGSLELLKGKLVEGDTRIYVCQQKVCKFPVNTVEKALPLMK